MKKKIGLYGGSFSPVHCGHVMACHWALMTGEFDNIMVIPTYNHSFKPNLMDFDHRINMLKIAFEHISPHIEISPVEKLLGKSITANTVEYLTSAMASLGIDAEFKVIIGSDLIAELPLWEEIERLRELAEFMIIDRSIYAGGISSTKVRKALSSNNAANNSYLKQAMPNKVYDYIIENKLF